jgi:hypothetical protein
MAAKKKSTGKKPVSDAVTRRYETKTYKGGPKPGYTYTTRKDRLTGTTTISGNGRTFKTISDKKTGSKAGPVSGKGVTGSKDLTALKRAMRNQEAKTYEAKFSTNKVKKKSTRKSVSPKRRSK